MSDLVGDVEENDAVRNIPKISVIINSNKTIGEINKLNKLMIATLHTSLTNEHNLVHTHSIRPAPLGNLGELPDLGGLGGLDTVDDLRIEL